jgi:3-hydroxyisobutyrate dehydrogenase
MKVGFIGIGNMGWPMSGHIQQKGHDVIVYDSDAARCAEWVRAHGGRAAHGPADFGDVEFVVTMLPTGPIVREVMLDTNGGVAKHLRPGTIVIDMSSSEPALCRALKPGH